MKNHHKNTILSEQLKNPNEREKIVDRDKIDTSNTLVHDRSRSWFGTGI